MLAGNGDIFRRPTKYFDLLGCERNLLKGEILQYPERMKYFAVHRNTLDIGTYMMLLRENSPGGLTLYNEVGKTGETKAWKRTRLLETVIYFAGQRNTSTFSDVRGFRWPAKYISFGEISLIGEVFRHPAK